MEDLRHYDTEQLEAELERRKRGCGELPAPLPRPNWSRVERMCHGYIHALHTEGRVHNDSDHYIYEAAMEAVYGREVWVDQ